MSRRNMALLLKKPNAADVTFVGKENFDPEFNPHSFNPFTNSQNQV